MQNPTEPVVVIGAGQSGLAAARALRDAGLRPLVLEASDRPAGSWPGYYDSLTLFSPAKYSAMPGLPFPGDPDHYPHRDEVVAYLQRYADTLDVEIRTNTRVETVESEGGGFSVHTATGRSIPASGIVAASGSFSCPSVPDLPGQADFTGELLHTAEYRSPKPYAGKRVIVVGAGNSAVQVGYEMAEVASVTLATHAPVHFLPQRPDGHRDVHHWLTTAGIDQLPLEWLAPALGGPLVLDIGLYQQALDTGALDRRPMFTAFDGDQILWSDGTSERADAVIFATGYRPSLDYLQALGALDASGAPLHIGGISTTHPGLVYLGLEFQRSFSSNTLRGVSRDAEFVIPPLAAHIRKATTAIGLSA